MIAARKVEAMPFLQFKGKAAVETGNAWGQVSTLDSAAKPPGLLRPNGRRRAVIDAFERAERLREEQD